MCILGEAKTADILLPTKTLRYFVSRFPVGTRDRNSRLPTSGRLRHHHRRLEESPTTSHDDLLKHSTRHPASRTCFRLSTACPGYVLFSLGTQCLLANKLFYIICISIYVLTASAIVIEHPSNYMIKL